MNSPHNPPIMALLLPCHNEEDALMRTLPLLHTLIERLSDNGKISDRSFILVCDDGSLDGTWSVVSDYSVKYSGRVRGISLNTNRGQQIALMALLNHARDLCDFSISIDADLQDPPEVIELMVDQFHDGNEVVLGVRANRKTDSFFKRLTANTFYSIQSGLGVNSVPQHADFRLLSQRAMAMLSQYHERNLYLRGIVPDLGLKQAIVQYCREKRVDGKSKYPLSRMIALSADGITSFTTRPIRLILLSGLLLLFINLIMTVYVFVSYFSGNVIPGWTSLMLSLWFLSSLIIIAIGIVGEYVGKIYIEVKQRPLYFIKDVIK